MTPRKTIVTTTTDDSSGLSGSDVFKLMEHIDLKVDGVKREIMGVIVEGRVAHTHEHETQQVAQAQILDPIQKWFEKVHREDERRDARMRPLVQAATWVTNHWIVSASAVGLALAGLTHIGVIRP